MKIWLSGGSGFIGSHVAQVLKEVEGYEIFSFDRQVDASHDLQNYEAVHETMSECDIVVHLSAQVSVWASITDVRRFVGSNTLGTANVCQAAAENGIRKFVYASSMSVYGNAGYCSETAPLKPTNPYGLSKKHGEDIVRMYCDLHHIPWTALRLWNVYGPGQSLENRETGAVANCASAILGGRRFTLYDLGRNKRDWVHVKDVANAFMLATRPSIGGQAYNIGSGSVATMKEVAYKLWELLGSPEESEPEITKEKRIGDATHCWPNLTKAENELNFRAQIQLNEGLKSYARWLTSQKSPSN